MSIEIIGLLREAMDRHASDIHLVTGLPPLLRVNGHIVTTQNPPLERGGGEALLYPILKEAQVKEFEARWRLCVSTFFPDIGHFRITLYYAGGNAEGAIRVCPPVIAGLEELGLPEPATDLARKHAGLVLITGPTGMGKTTTMAAMVDQINRERQAKIVMVEDPIEYRHLHRKSVVVQQEVGSDVKSFGEALVHILRMDPDVICVGEMRDLETISTALTAAETGHLVLATLHTPDSAGTVDRILDVFPASQQPQIITQLSAALQGVLSQQLIPRVDKPGRVLATEVLIANQAVRNLIRERKTHQLYSAIQMGGELGMRLMDDSLKELYESGIISYDDAVSRAHDAEHILSDSGGRPNGDSSTTGPRAYPAGPARPLGNAATS